MIGVLGIDLPITDAGVSSTATGVTVGAIVALVVAVANQRGLRHLPLQARVADVALVVGIASALAIEGIGLAVMVRPWVMLAALGVAYAAMVGAAALTHATRPSSRWTPTATAVLSLVGVWAGVPEVDHTLTATGVLVGFALGAAIVGVRPPSGRALVIVVVWAVLQGSTGRAWPAVGGLLCLGILLVLPLIPAMAGWRRRGATSGRVRNARVAVAAASSLRWGRIELFAVHIGLVTVAARVVAAGEFGESWSWRLAGVAVWLVMAAVWVHRCTVVASRRRERA